MAKKKRQRISYVLPLASRPGGHRLGINGLSFDDDRNILYTGGRDGVICAWNLDLNAKHEQQDASLPPRRNTASFRREVQAHTHWVNDLVLVKNNLALVSASSDCSVKLWRPHSHEAHGAYSIGSHSDYVKCLSSPGSMSDWVASGGLDHRICLWDLSGKGQKLEINVTKAENVVKGSIYALKARENIIASGGPENVVRLWDVNTGKGITKLVGHTDNVRDILMSDDGDTVLTASSDQTIKVWSITAGRCMHTLTMHNDSVWCLYSDDPTLSIFYSGDKSGLVAKTDTRHADDIDDGVSVAVCQEHDGITRLALAGDSIWTATSNSSVNRWQDVDTELEVETPPPSPKRERTQSNFSRSIHSEASPSSSPPRTNGTITNGTEQSTQLKRLPHNAMLRMTNTAFHPGKKIDRQPNASVTNLRKLSEAIVDTDIIFIVPIRGHPEETIEGQQGLVKHVMLNDKKRILTLDTAGEVVLWDLLKCVPIRAFGRKHLDEVEPVVNSTESVANWCSVDTKTGKLTVMLEENYCFDAEVYADEIEIEEKIDFREDQRINLGKWVLRNLFTTLLDEELKRDEAFRKSLRSELEQAGSLKRENAPSGLNIPNTPDVDQPASPGSATTPRATQGPAAPNTPGMPIGLATPMPQSKPGTTHTTTALSPTAEEESGTEQTETQNNSQGTPDHHGDYFSQNNTNNQSDASSEHKEAQSPSDPTGPTSVPTSPAEEKKKKSGLFGKSFNMKMSFPNKLARTSTEVSKGPDIKAEEKADDQSDKSSEKEEPSRTIEDNFFGVVQKIRYAYQDHVERNPSQPLPLGITPSMPIETPVLKPPPHTLILIQEDNPEAGGLSDLYRGEISELGKEADVLEKTAPAWLGELLLRNEIPPKETAKVSFVLQPWEDKLPSIATADGNARLNANRMLRAKKVLAYVSERIEAAPDPENPKPGDELKPEEYMELLCQGQIVPKDMTLNTLRIHVWRTGGDVSLFYRANGKKEMRRAHPADIAGKDEGMGQMVKQAGIATGPPTGENSGSGNAASGGNGGGAQNSTTAQATGQTQGQGPVSNAV